MLERSVHLPTTACPHLRAPGAPWPGCAKPIRPDDQSNAGTENNMPDNAFVEAFNARFRDECLNEEVVETLTHARRALARWRYDYNHVRPHSALAGQTPASARRAPELFGGSAPGALANPNDPSYQTTGLSF